MCSLTLAFVCALFPIFTYAQAQLSHQNSAPAPSQDPLTRAIDEVKTGNWASVSTIVHVAGISTSIPILEELFLSSKDAETKEQIASTLMDLGDSKDVYWDFLLQQANEAIASDAPYPMFAETDGKGRADFSPAFAAWAKSHNLTANDAGELVMYRLPGHVMLLGDTHDTRAIPVLQKALKVHGFLIQVSAAEALAMLQDKDSIPLIVDACKNSPPEIASAIALFSLVRFDDPRAQSAAATYLSPDMLKSFEGKKLYLGPIPSREY